MARKRYPAEGITVTFDLARCIHAAECVRGLPEVFDPGERPWVRPERSDPDAVAEVVSRCPSGALKFEREDGIRESPARKNAITLAVDGPLYVRGDVVVEDSEGEVLYREVRAALCRCGASSNKPFCDNSHREIGFVHDGSLGENRLRDDETSDGGALSIIPVPNGPLLLRGEVEIGDAAGEASFDGTRVALCRCGRSANKPFCDASHARTGWREEV